MTCESAPVPEPQSGMGMPAGGGQQQPMAFLVVSTEAGGGDDDGEWSLFFMISYLSLDSTGESTTDDDGKFYCISLRSNEISWLTFC